MFIAASASDKGSSKSTTLEMYAPSSYNGTVNGETLSSISEKSRESYAQEVCGPLNSSPTPFSTFCFDSFHRFSGRFKEKNIPNHIIIYFSSECIRIRVLFLRKLFFCCYCFLTRISFLFSVYIRIRVLFCFSHHSYSETIKALFPAN